MHEMLIAFARLPADSSVNNRCPAEEEETFYQDFAHPLPGWRLRAALRQLARTIAGGGR